VTDHDILVEFGRVLWPFAILALALAYLFCGMWLKARAARGRCDAGIGRQRG
jgi:hypothetical protein